MLGDLLFEGLSFAGEWVLDRVFGDDEDDESAETDEQADAETDR
ncbi:hypothetical protein [Halorussus litoreus]|nr:hypothetical protein [Halorussus litoreus]